jgi:nitrous oxide reductase accessory protein NosL
MNGPPDRRRSRAPRLSGALVLALGLIEAACGRGSATGPAEVVWDRDTCERCAMAIGDRRFAAQIRSGASGEAHRFDDLGCASLWLDEHRAGVEDRPEAWVRDLRGERWLDATAAYYAPGLRSPMSYGFGASPEPVEGGIRWDEVRVRIREIENERRRRGR